MVLQKCRVEWVWVEWEVAEWEWEGWVAEEWAAEAGAWGGVEVESVI